MIVKGKARSGPAQLAAYLLRQDGKERPVLVDLWDGSDDLNKAFTAWHAIGEGTQGERTLYHAQISPEARYPMTPEQWKRAAEILADELGMGDHPRAIVVHEGHKNPHAHVVFQRADGATMTLWDDSFNYVKHERASKRMAEEFGHELVPGKHAKRDREKQPEFPREKLSTQEAQQEKRTGLSKAERVAEITALYRSADSGPALKAALEDAGYVLAKGERGYLVVDESGGQSVLTRNTGLKKKELEAFMKGVPLDSLPSVEEAKAIQKGKTEQGQAAIEAPAPSPEPEKQAPAPAAKEQGVEASKFVKARTAEKPAPPVTAPQDPKIAAIEKAVADRYREERKALLQRQAEERAAQGRDLERYTAGKVAGFDTLQEEERDALKARFADKPGLLAKLTGKAKQQEEARRRETRELERRQKKERADYLALLDKNKQLDIDNLREKQAQQLRDLETRTGEERDRYIEEHRQAERIRAELEEQRKREELERGGPEPPKRVK